MPLSIRLISSTSLIRLKRWLPDVIILLRYSLTCSLLSICVTARFVNPTIAFIGVRISCDILERNTLFALLALFAWCKASSRRLFCSISLRVSSSTLQNPRTMPLFSAQSPALTTFIWKYSILSSLAILKLT